MIVAETTVSEENASPPNDKIFNFIVLIIINLSSCPFPDIGKVRMCYYYLVSANDFSYFAITVSRFSLYKKKFSGM